MRPTLLPLHDKTSRKYHHLTFQLLKNALMYKTNHVNVVLCTVIYSNSLSSLSL